MDGLNAVTHSVGNALIDLKHAVSFEDLVPNLLNVRARSIKQLQDPVKCYKLASKITLASLTTLLIQLW